MSSLVAFDQKGVIGPAMTLIYNSQYYNEKGLLDIADLLKDNFLKLANIKAKGKKEFCGFILNRNKTGSPVTPSEVIGTKFFQSMQNSGPSPDYHRDVLEVIVPNVMKTVHEKIPQDNSGSTAQIGEWTARLLESYMTEEQIRKHCALQDAVSEKIQEERKVLGTELCKLITTKKFTEKDLDLFVETGRVALESLKRADHFASTLNIAGKYLAFFSMNEENPAMLGEDVLRMLTTVFRAKMFPKEN